MFISPARRCALGAVLTLLAGCASLPHMPDPAAVQALVDQRTSSVLSWPDERSEAARAATLAARARLLAEPLDADRAVALALLGNPRLQLEFARLGIAAADVFDARRISNPTLSLADLGTRRRGDVSRIDAGIGLSFSELLLMPARKRLAQAEFARTRELIGSAVLNLIADVRAAWFNAVAAQQIATLRDTLSTSAADASELAARFHNAGNLSELELNLQQASATQARLAATRARAEARRARSTLEQLLGSAAAEIRWDATVALPDLPPQDDALDVLLPLAHAQRLDLLAAAHEVESLQSGLALTQSYRWFGAVEIGATSERDDDHTRLSGPTLALQLPIFNQGQAAVARAQARLSQAQAREKALQLEVDTAVRIGVDRLTSARAIVVEYRDALIPQRESVLAQTQLRQNFNLVGAFELLLTRQQEYDAYEAYLDAVRDYWLARCELTGAIGTTLPSDAGSARDGRDRADTVAPSTVPGSAGSPPPPVTRAPRDPPNTRVPPTSLETIAPPCVSPAGAKP